MKTFLWCGAAVLALAATGCDAPKLNAPAAGAASIETTAPAARSASAVTATAPNGWYAMTSDQQAAMVQRGIDIAVDKPELHAVAKNAVKRTGKLFAFFKYAPGSPSPDNASVMAIAEDVGALPGMKTGKDYFFQMQKMFEQSAIKPEMVGDYSTRMIDGQSFDKMDIILNVTVPVKESIYAARHGDYVYSFVQMYLNEADRATTDGILDSVKLHW